MKLLNKLSIFAAAAFIFSCSNIANIENNEEPVIQENNTKAAVVLNISAPAARTALAPVNGSKFTDIDLQYKAAGAGEYTSLATYATAAEITSATPVYLEAGTYDFSVSAKNSGFIYKAEKSGVELVKGTNTVNIALELYSMDTPKGNGKFEITFAVPNKEVSNYATYSLFKDDVLLTDYSAVAAPVKDNDTNDTVTVTAKLDSGLESGIYKLKIQVYADENKTLEVAAMEDIIQLADGETTTKAYSTTILEVTEIAISDTARYIKNNGKVYIYGTGELSLNKEAMILMSAKNECYLGKEVTEVYIGDGITTIGMFFFSYCKNLKKVTGAINVTKIDMYAFPACSELESIPSFNEVTAIGESAFSACKSLKSIGDNNQTSFAKVETLDYGAFYRCESLEVLPAFNNVTTIGKSVFERCISLKTVSGFNSITSISKGMFNSCSNLETVSGFANITEIKDEAFIDCRRLTSFQVINKLRNIGNSAFKDCEKLTNYPFKVITNEIDESAFENCKALDDTDYNYSDWSSIGTIGNSAFKNCKKLTKIYISQYLSFDPASAYEGCTNISTITQSGGNLNYFAVNNCILKGNYDASRNITSYKVIFAAKDATPPAEYYGKVVNP